MSVESALAGLVAQAVRDAVAPLEARIEHLTMQLAASTNRPSAVLATALGWADAARYCGVSVKTLRQAHRLGELHSRAVRGPNGARLFDRAELDRWLGAKQAHQPAPIKAQSGMTR